MNRRALILLSVVFIASGCANGGSSVGSSGGLVVEDFSITDEELSANQQATITVMLENHNSEPVEIHDVSLFNTGELEVGDGNCRPSDDELEGFNEERVPVKECEWVVETDELENFRKKKTYL